MVDAVDPARVDLESGRFATLGRIIDNDRKCGNAVLFALYEGIEKRLFRVCSIRTRGVVYYHVM